jgi:uncharacterized protein (DUF488 family)
MNKIFSIGHSNRGFSEFLEKLQENKVDTIIDVRTFPRSRFCPHFNQKRLATELNAQNITYLFKGDRLGGKGENRDYQGAIDELVEMSSGKIICIMCSEGKYKDCHRYSLIAPSLEEKGVEIEHISY